MNIFVRVRVRVHICVCVLDQRVRERRQQIDMRYSNMLQRRQDIEMQCKP